MRVLQVGQYVEVLILIRLKTLTGMLETQDKLEHQIVHLYDKDQKLLIHHVLLSSLDQYSYGHQFE